MTETTIATQLAKIVNSQRTDIIHLETLDPLPMMYDLIQIIREREAQIDDLLKRVEDLENRNTRIYHP